MKVPLSPPPLAELFPKLAPKDLPRVLGMRLGPLVGGRYFHWDELRHRTPPKDLSHEAWWAGIKIARQGLLRPLPFVDKHKRPVLFGMPDPVLRALHEIDRRVGGAVAMDKPIGKTGSENNFHLYSPLIRSLFFNNYPRRKRWPANPVFP